MSGTKKQKQEESREKKEHEKYISVACQYYGFFYKNSFAVADDVSKTVLEESSSAEKASARKYRSISSMYKSLVEDTKTFRRILAEYSDLSEASFVKKMRDEEKVAMVSVEDFTASVKSEREFYMKNMRIYYVPFCLYGTVKNIANHIANGVGSDSNLLSTKKKLYKMMKKHLETLVGERSKEVVSLFDIIEGDSIMKKDDFETKKHVAHLTLDKSPVFLKPSSEEVVENQTVLKALKENTLAVPMARVLSRLFSKSIEYTTSSTTLAGYYQLFSSDRQEQKILSPEAIIFLATATGAVSSFSLNGVPKNKKNKKQNKEDDDSYVFCQNTFELSNSTKQKPSKEEKATWHSVQRFMNYASILQFKPVGELTSSSAKARKENASLKLYSYLRRQLGIKQDGSETKSALKGGDKAFDLLFGRPDSSKRRYILIDKYDIESKTGFTLSESKTQKKSPESKVLRVFSDTMSPGKIEELKKLLMAERKSSLSTEDLNLMKMALVHCLAYSISVVTKKKESKKESKKKASKKKTVSAEEKVEELNLVLDSIFRDTLLLPEVPKHHKIVVHERRKKMVSENLSDDEDEDAVEEDEEREEEQGEDEDM